MPITSRAVDFDAIKIRQQATWSSGNYAHIGTSLQITGEMICEAVDLGAGERVLDVAAGNGNAALAAARRGASVTAADYVPGLLKGARARAAAEGLTLEVRNADAEALPFDDAAFDVVLSTFGVMFTPNQERAAVELVRVVGRHVPPSVRVSGIARPNTGSTRFARTTARSTRRSRLSTARDNARSSSTCWRSRTPTTRRAPMGSGCRVRTSKSSPSKRIRH